MQYHQWSLDSFPQARDLLQSMGVSPDHIHNINISGRECVPELTAALKDTQGLVICTSAVPEVNMLQTVTGGLGHLLGGLVKRNKEDTPFVPVATWKGGQTPEKVRGCDGCILGFCQALAPCKIAEKSWHMGEDRGQGTVFPIHRYQQPSNRALGASMMGDALMIIARPR